MNLSLLRPCVLDIANTINIFLQTAINICVAISKIGCKFRKFDISCFMIIQDLHNLSMQTLLWNDEHFLNVLKVWELQIHETSFILQKNRVAWMTNDQKRLKGYCFGVQYQLIFHVDGEGIGH